MRQLTLDLLRPAPASLDNFVVGSNQEVVHTLQAIAIGERRTRFVHLWGAPATGKSHLLGALGGLSLSPQTPLAAFRLPRGARVITMDDCDQLDAERQHALFHLYNQVLAQTDVALVSASRSAPASMTVREELRTRLAWGLVMQLQPLTDQDRLQALRAVAKAHGAHVADEVLEYLATRKARDMRSQLQWLQALDRYGLERKRPLTLPLLRELESRQSVPVENAAAGKLDPLHD
jgi:DnaA family protein